MLTITKIKMKGGKMNLFKGTNRKTARKTDRKAVRKSIRKTTCVIVALALLSALVGYVPEKTKGVLAEESGITQSDFLKADGTELKNNYGSGDTVVLRGVNAGGWLIQEPWMCATEESDNVECQSDIIDVLSQRFGKSQAEDLLNVYEDNYWTESDFDNCKNMGMNVIRLPFWYKNIVDDDGNVKDDAFSRIDWFVDECADRGIYVILDLHGAPGSQNGEVHSGDTSGVGLFEGSNTSYNQQLTTKVWTEVAGHFEGNPTIAGYDLLNEPYTSSRRQYTSRTVWNFYDELYDAIREVDGDHVLIMESTWEPSQLPNPSQYGWENIMYEYHQYNYDSQTEADDQLSGINNKISEIQESDYGVPSYIGETSFFSNTNSWRACLQRLNDAGINWTLWTYKVTGRNNSWGIYNQNIQSANLESDTYSQIEQKWSNVGTASKNNSIYNIVSEYLQKGVSKNADGEGRYEAELADYISSGGSIRTMTSDFGVFSNDGYVEALNGNKKSSMGSAKYVEFKVNVDTAGTYQVMTGYATTTDTTFAVKANDDDWVYREVSSTGAWDSIWEAPVSIYLNKGENVVKLSGAIDDDGDTWIILDYFDLTLTKADETATDSSSEETTTKVTEETTKKSEATTKEETTSNENTKDTSDADNAQGSGVAKDDSSKEALNEYLDKDNASASNVVKLKKAKIKKLKNNKKRSVRLAIKKVKNADGYKIRYSKKKNFKKKKTKSTKKRRYTVKKLKTGKYFFKVRAYKNTDSGKVYGKWSKVKKVYVKK